MLTIEQVRAKSSAKIATLAEPVRTAATLLVNRCYLRGIMIVITEALRTYAYQNYLYSKGRTLFYENGEKLEIVTKARGGYSNHNFGYAFDFALLLPNGKTVSWDTKRSDNLDSLPDWSEVVIEGKKLGLEWGGDWRKFVDLPHFQMVFGLSTAQFRAGKRPSGAQIASALEHMRGSVKPPVEDEQPSIAYKFTAGGKAAGTAIMNGDTAYVPMVDLARYIGVPYAWDNEEKVASLNGRPLQSVKLVDGRVYVQLRAVATAYQKSVFYDSKTREVGVV